MSYLMYVRTLTGFQCFSNVLGISMIGLTTLDSDCTFSLNGFAITTSITALMQSSISRIIKIM